MAQIRNGKLAAGHMTKGPAAIAYQVPAGFGAIVKFIGMTPTTSIEWHPTAGVVAIPQAVVVWLILQDAQPSTTAIWNQWIALDAGDYIQMAASETDFNFYIAGAELPYLSSLGAAAITDLLLEGMTPFEPPVGGSVLYLPEVTAELATP